MNTLSSNPDQGDVHRRGRKAFVAGIAAAGLAVTTAFIATNQGGSEKIAPAAVAPVETTTPKPERQPSDLEKKVQLQAAKLAIEIMELADRCESKEDTKDTYYNYSFRSVVEDDLAFGLGEYPSETPKYSVTTNIVTVEPSLKQQLDREDASTMPVLRQFYGTAVKGYESGKPEPLSETTVGKVGWVSAGELYFPLGFKYGSVFNPTLDIQHMGMDRNEDNTWKLWDTVGDNRAEGYRKLGLTNDGLEDFATRAAYTTKTREYVDNGIRYEPLTEETLEEFVADFKQYLDENIDC